MDWRVEDYISKLDRWQEEHLLARQICLECGLSEDFKWRQPCYTSQGKNIVILSGMKDYFAFGFFKGALIKNTRKILIQPTENMQAARQICYHNSTRMRQDVKEIKAIIRDAIEIEKAGKEVSFKSTDQFDVPVELSEKFQQDKAYEQAFEALTPGRQRGYLLHFGSAKHSETRKNRIEKFRDKIFMGKGFNER